jgi:hypothetical protein
MTNRETDIRERNGWCDRLNCNQALFGRWENSWNYAKRT